MAALNNTSILSALETSAVLQNRFQIAIYELVSMFVAGPTSAPFDTMTDPQRVVLSGLVKSGIDRPQVFTLRVLRQALSQTQFRTALGTLVGDNASSSALIAGQALTDAIVASEKASDTVVRAAVSAAIPVIIGVEIGYTPE